MSTQTQLLIGLAAITIVVAVATLRQSSQQTDLPPGVHNADVEVRRKAFRALLNEPPQTRPEVAMAAGTLGLRDPDADVRKLSSMLLRQVLYYLPAKPPLRLEPSKFPNLPTALKAAACDPDPKTRSESLGALVSLNRISPGVLNEDFVLERLETEQNDQVRVVLVQCIEAGGFRSQQSIGKLLEAVAGDNEGVAGYAARALAQIRPPPAEALPVLVEHLDPTHVFSAQFILDALANYGPEAAPFLPRLKELSGQTENDVLQQKFAHAIAAIEGAQQNPQLPQSRPATGARDAR